MKYAWPSLHKCFKNSPGLNYLSFRRELDWNEAVFRNCDVWERLIAKQGSGDDMCLAALFLLLKDLEIYRNKGEVVQAQFKG